MLDDISKDNIVENDEELEHEYESYDITYNLTSYGIDFPVDSLVNRYQKEKVYLPNFQRNYVWNKKQASKFIESLLLGLPVPGIFLYRDKDEKMLIIDGYQRIESLYRYFNNSFDDRAFNLSGVNEYFSGKNYSELKEDEKDKMATSIIHATIIKADNPEDKNIHAIYEIFERLNTGGVKLSPQEVRNCVSDGPLRKKISELSSSTVVKNFLSIDNKRKKDEEVVLRLLALSFNQYTGNMKQFLNKFMFDNKDLKDVHINGALEIFPEIVEFMDKLNAKEYFMKENNLISIAVLDSLWVGIYKNYEQLKEKSPVKIKEQINKLMLDKEYKESIKTGTTHNTASVKERVEKAVDFLKNV